MDAGEEGDIHIPPEIIEENILWRVSSVKDLEVFRSVCKSWKTLIDSDDFKKKHFEATKHNNASSTILVWRKSLGDEPTLHMLYPQTDKIIELALGGGDHGLCFKRFGTVKGLVCLGCASFHVILNPSTRNYTRFNAPPVGWDLMLLYRRFNDFISAFAFDPVSQDYKFLMAAFESSIPLFVNNKTIVYFQLYSLKNNSWKGGFVEFPNVTQLVSGDGYMEDDGKCYWFAKHCGSNHFKPALIVFDFSANPEVFHLMPLVGQEFAGIHEGVAVANCGYLEMLLTFIHREGDEDEDLQCEVWRMQNDGSWIRRIAVVFPKEVGTPIGISKEGKLMFNDEFDGLLLINPDTLSCTIVRINALQLRVFNFVESLFSVIF